jgi:SH3 domain-containing YSC84-like protein 1
MNKPRSILIASLVALPLMAAPTSKEATRLKEAEQVLTEAVNAPDKGIPKDLLERAECVGVFPSITKGAIVVGGEYGRGVFTCRQPDGTMGAPAFFTIGGGSVGWQFGGKEADLILLVMNDNGVKHLLADKFSIGGEASAAAGPVGRTAEAATDAQLHAQLLSWSRSRGAFVGVSVEGNIVKPDPKTNESFYGRPITARDILVDHTAQVPPAGASFVASARKYTRRES